MVPSLRTQIRTYHTKAYGRISLFEVTLVADNIIGAGEVRGE